MTRVDNNKLQPPVPFMYEMVISFFEAARETLDPVLQAINGYRQLETLQDGRPAPPNHVVRKFVELPGDIQVGHIGACLTATTNLGLAYVHSFRLLSFLTQGKDALPPNATRPHLAKLYDALPTAVRRRRRRPLVLGYRLQPAPARAEQRLPWREPAGDRDAGLDRSPRCGYCPSLAGLSGT